MSAFTPILLSPVVTGTRVCVFFPPKREVEVQIPGAFVRSLIPLCDGTRTEDQIVHELRSTWDVRSIRTALSRLRKVGVLIDSRNIAPVVWDFVSNPTPWPQDLTPEQLDNLLADQSLHRSSRGRRLRLRVRHNAQTRQLSLRASMRDFGSNPVTQPILARLLWAAYGQTGTILHQADGNELSRRVVPSAGALYPLLLHLALFRPSGSIPAGVYRVLPRRSDVELAPLSTTLSDIRAAYVEPSVLTNAAGCLVVSGSVGRSASKYSNRGILYVILEAGHVAQNVLCEVQTENLAAVEVGGFIEEQLRVALRLEGAGQPLTSIVFGCRPGSTSSHPTQRTEQIASSASVVGQLVTAPRSVEGFTLPFSMVFGKVVTDDASQIYWSCGRARSLSAARTKSIAEGIEWYACGRWQRAELIIGSLVELGEQGVDPRTIIRYSSGQLVGQWGVRPFDPQKPYEWRRAVGYLTGEEWLILADFVYFPFTPAVGDRYAFANSSGTAAHMSTERAVEHAVFEIVERDAFMVAWLNRWAGRTIEIPSCPEDIRNRVRELKRLGFRVRLVDLTLDLSPVVHVVAHHPNLPYFTCSAASGPEVAAALDRALMEIEASIYCRLRDGKTRYHLKPDEVWRTSDHGTLYEERRWIRRAHFLLGGGSKRIRFTELERGARVRSFPQLCRTLQAQGLEILVVDLSSGDPLLKNLPFTVAKAFIPGLVPMTFHAGLEPLGLDRVRHALRRCGIIRGARPVIRLNRFPHPMT